LSRFTGFGRRSRAALATACLLVGVQFGVAENRLELFDAANLLYEQGEYQKAVEKYEALLGTNQVSAAVLFNIGNSWFKSGRIGRAIAAYRKAQRLSPRDPDVRANLQFARNQVQGPKWTATLLEKWLGRATLNEWTLLATGAFWLLFILLIMGHWRPGLARSFRWLLWVGALGTVVFGLCTAAAFQARRAHGLAVVIAPGVIVRHGPLEESSTAFTAQDGAELRLLDRKDGWLLVSDGKKNVGWVRQEQVLLL
jgi:tetratricopeptide (TPR) repeat protein